MLRKISRDLRSIYAQVDLAGRSTSRQGLARADPRDEVMNSVVVQKGQDSIDLRGSTW
jgi:hypothetical protein